MSESKRPTRRPHLVYLCLLIPFAAMLFVPSYNRIEPTFFGIPFFYWYQTIWTLLGAFCTLPVYLYEERNRK